MMKWTIGFLTLAILGVAAYRLAPNPDAKNSLPVFGEIAEFSLVNQEGQRFTAENLKDSVYVVNFIFSSCPGVCPLLTKQMVKVQKQLGEKSLPTKFLSISVDPERDTPEVLKAYGQRFGADFQRWDFLTGDLNDIRTVVVESFKTMMGNKEATEEDPNLFDIVHGENFVILDRNSRIRSFQKIKTQEDIRRVVQIVQMLEAEKAGVL